MNYIYRHLLKSISSQIDSINQSLDVISNSDELKNGSPQITNILETLNSQLVELTKLKNNLYKLALDEENNFLEKEAIHIWQRSTKCYCGKTCSDLNAFEAHQQSTGHEGKMIGVISFESLDKFKNNHLKNKI